MIKKIIKLVLIFFLGSFIFINPQGIKKKVQGNLQDIAQEPKNNQYITDEKKYLKTFYLLKKGLPFYQASFLAFKYQTGQDEVEVWNKDFWGWRLPFVFFLWSFWAQNGQGIFGLFICFSLLTLAASFLLAKKIVDKKLALLAPLMLLPYFINALKSNSFLFLTWWAFFFFSFGLTALFYYQKRILSSLFFTLALLSREHLVISIAAMLIIAFVFKKKKHILVFSLPLLVFTLMIIFHQNHVNQFVILKENLGFTQRLSFFGKNIPLAALAFSTNSYLLTSLRPGLVWLTSSVLGLLFLILKLKSKVFYIYALASFLPLFIGFGFMGQSLNHDYWGPMFLPLTAIFSLSLVKAFETNEK